MNTPHTAAHVRSISTRFDVRLGQRMALVEPAGHTPLANVLMVHGLGDHMGRHLRTARDLAAHGFRAVLFDLAAHGTQPHDFAEVAWVDDLYAQVDEARDLVAAFQADPRLTAVVRSRLVEAQQRHLASARLEQHLAQTSMLASRLAQVTGDDARPWFLLGHSMGGLIAVETAWRMAGTTQGQVGLRGVVLVAPALEPQGDPDNPLMRAAITGLWALRRAPLSLTRAAAKAALDLPVSLDTSWGNKWISDQADEVTLFETDPLIPHRMPTRYASTIESQMVKTATRRAPFPVDALVVVPAVDGITSREAGVRFARRLAAAPGPAGAQLVELGVAAHDVLRSSARGAAVDAITRFISAQLERCGLPRSA